MLWYTILYDILVCYSIVYVCIYTLHAIICYEYLSQKDTILQIPAVTPSAKQSYAKNSYSITHRNVTVTPSTTQTMLNTATVLQIYIYYYYYHYYRHHY